MTGDGTSGNKTFTVTTVIAKGTAQGVAGTGLVHALDATQIQGAAPVVTSPKQGTSFASPLKAGPPAQGQALPAKAPRFPRVAGTPLAPYPLPKLSTPGNLGKPGSRGG